MMTSLAVAQENPDIIQKAKELHLALTGTHPLKAELYRTVDFLKAGKKLEAATYIANHDPAFYNVMVKNLVTPWTNQGGSITNELNDMSALMIGFIRDDLPFNQIFYQDTMYLFKGDALSATLTPGSALSNSLLGDTAEGNRLRFVAPDQSGFDFRFGGTVHYVQQEDWIDPFSMYGYEGSATPSMNLTARTPGQRHGILFNAFPSADRLLLKDARFPDTRYIISKFYTNSNAHFSDAAKLGLNLKDPAILFKVKQSDYLHTDERAVSGILSTREFGKAYLKAGTNRAAVSFTMKHFFCQEMDQLKDTTISDSFVRKDIARIPGGIELTYKNNCAGCHTGMDPIANAFSFHDFTGDRLVYTYNTVVAKLNRTISNDDVQIGHRVRDDRWINFWNTGLNSRLGWGETTEGYGINSLGRMYAGTKAFAPCMSKRVFEKVCLNNVRKIDDVEAQKIPELARKFETSEFNMKNLIIEASLVCKERP